jgi:Protein of unknown function (DUF3800)
MRLRDGGIDIFYIDESNDGKSYVLSAITVPFLRNINGIWTITWPSHLDAAKQWRRSLRQSEGIPASKELHGVKLASGSGRYFHGKWQFNRSKAGAVYRNVLASMNFIPGDSIISVAARRSGAPLYGKTRLDAALYGLLQRMRTQCNSRQTNAIVFFDQGHPEYRKLYRQSMVFLPTGSMYGGWESGSSKNLNLDMFTKDANDKNSFHCYFTQAADLIAYSVFLKIKSEHGELTPWQAQYNLGNLYDSIPRQLINLKASSKSPRDGIVRL